MIADPLGPPANDDPSASAGPAATTRATPRAVIMLVLAAWVLPLNISHVVRYVRISPIDELTHADYLIRAANLELVGPSDTLSQETMRDAACRGSDGAIMPPCGRDRYRADDFIWRGLNSASTHSPYYYVTTGVVARVLRAVLPGDSLITWGRVAGSAWLLLGMYASLRAGELLGVQRQRIAVVLMMAAPLPTVLLATTTINPDVTAFPAGAAMLWATLAWLRARARLWWVGLAAFGCASADPTNVLAVLMVALLLVLLMLRRAARIVDVRAAILAASVVLLSSAAAIAAWMLVVLARPVVDMSGSPMEVAQVVSSIELVQVLGVNAVFAMFPPSDGYIPPILVSSIKPMFSYAANVLLGGPTVLQALVGGLDRVRTQLAIATVAAVLLGGPLLVLRNFYLASTYFPISPRYGLSLLPAMLVVVAGILHTSRAVAIAGIVAVGLYASTMVALWR